MVLFASCAASTAFEVCEEGDIYDSNMETDAFYPPANMYEEHEGEDVYESPEIAGASYPPEPEAHILATHEEDFLNALNAVGLDWGFAEMHRYITQPATPEFRTQYNYFITCPSNLIMALVAVRRNANGGGIWGTVNVYMTFVPVGIWTEYDFNRIDQEGFLTDDELRSFFALAGMMLREEESASVLAGHILDYISNFPFLYCNENSFGIFIDDREGEIDYRFILTWDPSMERYTNYEMTFTVGLCEFYREFRKRIDLGG